MPKPPCVRCQVARSTADEYCNKCREDVRAMHAPKMVPLRSIRVDGGTQARVKCPEHRVVEYVDALGEGAVFPPVVLFFDGVDHWMADGFTRFFAHKRSERAEILAEVREGTRRDALQYALSANATHGEPRTNEDKRKAVTLAMADREWAGLTDQQLADLCRVSRGLVNIVRREVAGKPPSPSRAKEPDSRPSRPSTPAPSASPRQEQDEPPAEEPTSDVPPPDTRTFDAVGIPIEGKEMLARFAASLGRATVARKCLRDAMDAVGALCQGPGGEHLATEVGAKLKGEQVVYRDPAIAQALARLKDHVPHVSRCAYCHAKGGQVDPKCKACRGLDYLTRQQWRQCPDDLQQALLAAYAEAPGQEGGDE